MAVAVGVAVAKMVVVVADGTETPIRDRAALEAAVDAGRRFKYLLFWGHRPSPGRVTASCLSQWWAGAPFVIDGDTYATAEHFMMAEKARIFDPAMRAQILAAPDPGTAKKLGRQVKHFDGAIWDAERFEVVVQGNVAKFGQHPDLFGFLVGTKDQVLVEASPRDRIWGIGMGAKNEAALIPSKWRGRNLLGFALMEARARLTAQAAGRPT